MHFGDVDVAPLACTVPLVRPAWITSSSAMKIASVVTADSIVPVRASPNVA
ncbi:MAG: hypothetical protein ACXWCM_13960 [Acidimicrobiales bacterium]